MEVVATTGTKSLSILDVFRGALYRPSDDRSKSQPRRGPGTSRRIREVHVATYRAFADDQPSTTGARGETIDNRGVPGPGHGHAWRVHQTGQLLRGRLSRWLCGWSREHGPAGGRFACRGRACRGESRGRESRCRSCWRKPGRPARIHRHGRPTVPVIWPDIRKPRLCRLPYTPERTASRNGSRSGQPVAVAVTLPPHAG